MRRDPKDTQKVQGQHAVRALFARRPHDLVRVYVEDGAVKELGDLLRACAERRLPYKVVGADELEAITESKHHEGICVVARRPDPARLEEILARPGPGWLVALAEVGNPHNLGAIFRVAAHFGARAALVGAAPSAAALRTAQGGAEWVDLVKADPLPPALETCRGAGFLVCATSSHEGQSLYAGKLPARAVVLLGAEGEGVPRPLLRHADLTLRIPGTGHVESLNVAAASAVILGELWRQHGRK